MCLLYLSLQQLSLLVHAAYVGFFFTLLALMLHGGGGGTALQELSCVISLPATYIQTHTQV